MKKKLLIGLLVALLCGILGYLGYQAYTNAEISRDEFLSLAEEKIAEDALITFDLSEDAAANASFKTQWEQDRKLINIYLARQSQDQEGNYTKDWNQAQVLVMPETERISHIYTEALLPQCFGQGAEAHIFDSENIYHLVKFGDMAYGLPTAYDFGGLFTVERTYNNPEGSYDRSMLPGPRSIDNESDDGWNLKEQFKFITGVDTNPAINPVLINYTIDGQHYQALIDTLDEMVDFESGDYPLITPTQMGTDINEEAATIEPVKIPACS